MAGVLLVAGGDESAADAARIASLLEALFDETRVVSGTDLPGLVAALEAASADRVLVWTTGADGALPASPELLLALVAWPEHDAVLPAPEGGWHAACGLYLREPTLAAARASLDSGEQSADALLDALDVSRIAGADLEALHDTRS